MRDQIEYEAEHQETSLIGILRKPSYRKRLILGCLIQIGQQICGISAINYYQTVMYKTLGIKGVTVLALAGVWGLTGPLQYILLLWIIDRVKRHLPLIFWESCIRVSCRSARGDRYNQASMPTTTKMPKNQIQFCSSGAFGLVATCGTISGISATAMGAARR